MSDRERVVILREALEQVRKLTFRDEPPWCPMRTCQLHTGKWALIQATAARAQRETEGGGEGEETT